MKTPLSNCEIHTTWVLFAGQVALHLRLFGLLALLEPLCGGYVYRNGERVRSLTLKQLLDEA